MYLQETDDGEEEDDVGDDDDDDGRGSPIDDLEASARSCGKVSVI